MPEMGEALLSVKGDTETMILGWVPGASDWGCPVVGSRAGISGACRAYAAVFLPASHP